MPSASGDRIALITGVTGQDGAWLAFVAKNGQLTVDLIVSDPSEFTLPRRMRVA